MPSDAPGIEPNMATIAVHWERLGPAVAGAIALEAADHSGQARIAADVERDALWFRTITVLETIRALRETGDSRLFRLFPEIPLRGPRDLLCWRNLIAMRNLMVHEWWTIDEAIVRATVRNDFPSIARLTASIHILATPQDDPGSARSAALAEAADPQNLRDVIYQTGTGELNRLRL